MWVKQQQENKNKNSFNVFHLKVTELYYFISFWHDRTNVWRMPLSSAPGHTGYVQAKQQNYMIAGRKLDNTRKSCKGNCSLWEKIQSGSKHGQTGEIVRSSRDNVFIYNIRLCWEFLTTPQQTYHKFSHEHEGVSVEDTKCKSLKTGLVKRIKLEGWSN